MPWSWGGPGAFGAMMPLMLLSTLLFWLAVILGIVALVRWAATCSTQPDGHAWACIATGRRRIPRRAYRRARPAPPPVDAGLGRGLQAAQVRPCAARRAWLRFLRYNASMKEIANQDLLYERQARLCQVLSDPKRLRLLNALRHGERSVGELAETLGVPYPNVSQHLNVMRDADLVATRRAGTTIFYRLAYPRIVEACDIIHDILRAQLADAAALAGR